MAFSPNGKLLAVSGGLGFVKLWETAAFQEVGTLAGNAHGVVFSPDGQRLALSNGGKKMVALWDVESQQELLTLEGTGNVSNTGFSPDGNVIGCRSWKEILHLWRAPSWAEIEAADKAKGTPKPEQIDAAGKQSGKIK